MTLEVADSIFQRMCEDVQHSESVIGISYHPKGDTSIPAPGTIGSAAQIQDIIRTTPAIYISLESKASSATKLRNTSRPRNLIL
jgi:hypothetical protein